MTEHESTTETTSAPALTPGIDPTTNRVSSDYLSCEIPEGWEASVNSIDAHYAFEMRPEGASEDDGVQVLCIRMAPYEEDMRSVATPELLLALRKLPHFSLENIRNPALARPLDYHEVQGQGCTVAVMQVRMGNNDGFEFYLFQDGSRGDWMRATFYSWDENDKHQLRKARAIVDRLAASISAPRMELPERMRAFQECLEGKVDPERFRELAQAYAQPLSIVKRLSQTMAAYMIEAYNPSEFSGPKRVRAALEQYASFNRDTEPYLERIADAADAQARYYDEGSEQLDTIRTTAANIVSDLLITPSNVGSIPLSANDLQQGMRELAIIADKLANPTKTTKAAIEDTLVPSERTRALFSRLGIELGKGEPEESAEPDPKPTKSRDVDVPTLVMSLLSDGYVSFEDSDISKKKEHHLIAGVQVSEEKRGDLALIAQQNGFDDANELVSYFVSALQEIEKDEAFFVPKKTGINKGLNRIVRKGDLTGITFANMANYEDSFRIQSEGPNAYQVEYGEPVAIGIPRFFGMACRLIWDLRQFEDAQRGIPFSVRFSRIGVEFTRIGRQSTWWEYPKVTFVDGAQDDPILVNVVSAPSTDLTEGVEFADGRAANVAAELESMDLPTTMITMLSDGYVSFGDKDLSWSKGHHVICGLQTGSPMNPRLATLARVNGFKNTDDLLEHFMAFMKQADKDKELIVPKAAVSKVLHPIVRRGDLTAITLANLAASKAAFRVSNDSPNNYTVTYDESLADGIPRFFGLMCRLIWDLRQCVEPLKGATFQVTFTSCHNPELAQLLRGNVSRVDGAQDNPGTVDVTDAPAIDLKHGVTLRPAAAAPEPATKPEPVAAPEPAPKPESVVKPVPEPKPAPEPKPQPKPAPEPKPQPKPTPQPKPAPEPEPKPTKSRSVDPMLPLTLLADDFVFFQGTDIAWERGHHVIRGIKANLPKMEQLNEIVHKNGFDSFAELGERLVSILLRVEKDKALVVPRNKVSKALYPILPDGDLTGITLANLTAYMAAFRVLDAGPNAYAVMYDPSLADGIPHFFGLMCRLLWDLRKCSTTMKDVPFRVTFTSYCVPDLPQLLEGCVWRDNGPKANPGTLSVIKAPQVDPKQWITPDPTAAAKWAPDISKKRMEFEIFLDRLLAAATKHAKAFDTLCRRYYTLDDSRDFVSRRMEQLTEGLSRAQGNQEFSKERFDENVAHKRELQENRKELISQTRQLEERARELEKQRADLGFFSIFKKVDIAVELSEIARQQDELRKRIKEIEDEHKSLTKSGMVLFCELREKEKQVARIQAKLERLSQKERELTKRLENVKRELPALKAEDSETMESMIRALAQYNGFISGLPFTSAERESNEYREMRELMVSTLPKLREQGLRPTGRAAFPTFRPDWEE